MSVGVLGKGLSALLREEVVPIELDSNSFTVNIIDIEASAEQPRKIFDQEKIKELADSIISNGLIQPIIVNKLNSGKYKIIAGERRYRACKIAGLTQISVVIRDVTDKQMLEIALVENIQRQELTVIEESEAYDKLMHEFGYTQAHLATVLGKSRSHIANLLRLNQLSDHIKQMVNDGLLSMGHARCLIGIDNAEDLAKKIVSNDLNVRQTEDLTRKKEIKAKKNRNESEQDLEIDEDAVMLGYSLSEKFGVKVVVENSWNGGKISFHYSDLGELDHILSRL